MLSPEDKKAFDKTNEEVSKCLTLLKAMICGEHRQESLPDVIIQFSHECYTSDILLTLVEHLYKLEFEARKDVGQIFSQLLRRQLGDRLPTVEYFTSRDHILAYLVRGYEHQETALICGFILRECIKYSPLAQLALTRDFFFFSPDSDPSSVPPNAGTKIIMKLFYFVNVPTFDIASDAFATLKELVTRHKQMVSQFLRDEYDLFFQKFNSLMESSNYVTRRQSVKLLGELLSERSNYEIMTKYINQAENLKLLMNLLRDKSKNIQYEAFHVFKIFIANPSKSRPVQDILFRNKTRLLTFLSSFQLDRSGDESFLEERAYLVRQIEALDPPLSTNEPDEPSEHEEQNGSSFSLISESSERVDAQSIK